MPRGARQRSCGVQRFERKDPCAYDPRALTRVANSVRYGKARSAYGARTRAQQTMI
jgi:hypothetical protein